MPACFRTARCWTTSPRCRCSPVRRAGRPAADFVSSFVGRDRGYRALGFLTAQGIPVGPVAKVALGASTEDARAALDDGWAVVVDDSNHPLGWVSEKVLSTVDGQVRREDL